MNVAFIPAKMASQRFPRKNARACHGVPLVARAIRLAREIRDAGLVDTIVVWTDGDDIKTISQHEGLSGDEIVCVPFGSVGLNVPDAIWRWTDQGNHHPDAICTLIPAAPVRSANDVLATHILFTKHNADVAMTVAEVTVPRYLLQLTSAAALMGPYLDNTRPVYKHDGRVIWSRGACITDGWHFYTTKMRYGQVIPGPRYDIDYRDDFLAAEAELARREPLVWAPYPVLCLDDTIHNP